MPNEQEPGMGKGIHYWIDYNKIKNEKGERIEFDNHPFLFPIYADSSQFLTARKPAQVGMSTLEILKNHYDAKEMQIDIIYTLPTDADVKTFVGGKVNRIIANNKCMLADVADKDSIEQKQVGNSMIYFRGTWTKKAAIMVTADRLSHDEKDSSKLDVIADYQARLQHSKYKQIHTFSHPSLPEIGVDKDWLDSDQKHWLIKCTHCNAWQYLTWNTEDPKKMSIDMIKKIFLCKKCGGEITNLDRKLGQWVPRYDINKKKFSGYWLSLLMAPWMTAEDIIKKWQDPEITTEFFYTKVLGKPYADGTAKLLRHHFTQNLTGEQYAPGKDERIIIGIDTGLKIDFVLGNKHGLFHSGDCEDYDVLDEFMERWPKAIAVIDQGGDLIGSRKFAARWPGRVFLCMLTGDRTTKDLTKFGKGDEYGTCTADRNRMIQLVVDEFREKRIPIHGTEDDWFEYYEDWNRLSKIKIIDPDTNVVKGYKWARNGRDHLCFVAGTKILTANGEKNIEDITTNDRVLTRKGYRNVLHSGISNSDAETVIAKFTDGTLFEATPEHPIYTQRGLIPLYATVFCDMIETWKTNQLYSKQLHIGDIQKQKTEQTEFTMFPVGFIGKEVLVDCMKKYGKISMVKFLKVLLFITKTAIHSITRLKIWNVLPRQNTSKSIIRIYGAIQRLEKRCLKHLKEENQTVINGMERKRVKNIVERTLINIYIAIHEKINLTVKYAETFIQLLRLAIINTVPVYAGGIRVESDTRKIMMKKESASSVQNYLLQTNTGEGKLAQGYVQLKKLVKQKEKKRVYSLFIEDQHEYYANGILVGNCMATVFWRVGMRKFLGIGSIVSSDDKLKPNSYMVNPDQTVEFDPDELFNQGVQKSLDANEELDLDID